MENPAEIGVIDFIGVANKIKAIAGDNTTTFTVIATDNIGHVSEPLTLEVVAEQVSIAAELKDELYAPGLESQIQVTFGGNKTHSRKR